MAEAEASVALSQGAAGRELAPSLPVGFRVDAATLLEEQVDGTWAARERFPFS